LILVLLSLPMAAGAATGSGKADGVKLPEPLTKDAIRELVARLSDAEVRGLLLAQLDKVAAPEANKASAAMATGLAAEVDSARGQLGAVFRSAPQLPAELAGAVSRFSEGRTPHHLLIVAALLAVMAGGAVGLREGGGGFVAGVGRRHVPSPETSAGGNGGGLLIRALLGLFSLAVFAVTAVAFFLAVYQGHEASRELVVSALLAIIQVRLAILIARLLLAPH